MLTFNSPTRKEIAVSFISSLLAKVEGDKDDCAKAVSTSAENFMYYGISMIKNDAKYTQLIRLKKLVEGTIYDNNVPQTLKSFMDCLSKTVDEVTTDPFRVIYADAASKGREELTGQLAPLSEIFETSTVIEIAV
jgi:hypothetical protein